ncbi:hypothetical protein [Salmonella enterica]|uniref:hypothetical protein n=1 Tax=Salmonella enterica TaxID=28901 RepID=UPI0003A410A4|nr:hypothetical protein [Salmonella enterica]
MAVSDSLMCCCVGGYPVVIGGLARPETGNWQVIQSSLVVWRVLRLETGVDP